MILIYVLTDCFRGQYGILAEKELVAYCSPPLHPEAWLLGCLSDCSASCEASKEEPLPWHCRGDSAAVRRDCPPSRACLAGGAPGVSYEDMDTDPRDGAWCSMSWSHRGRVLLVLKATPIWHSDTTHLCAHLPLGRGSGNSPPSSLPPPAFSTCSVVS